MEEWRPLKGGPAYEEESVAEKETENFRIQEGRITVNAMRMRLAALVTVGVLVAVGCWYFIAIDGSNTADGVEPPPCSEFLEVETGLDDPEVTETVICTDEDGKVVEITLTGTMTEDDPPREGEER